MDDFQAPLIAKFSTARSKYLYDAKTGVIAKVDESLFAAFRESDPFEESAERHVGGAPEVAFQSGDPRLETISKMGLFRPAQAGSGAPRPEVVRGCLGAIAGRFSRMTLEVTQRCNLRCRYCPHTLNWSSARSHGASDMPWETARRAIDYFTDGQLCSSETGGVLPSLGFYGGEPFLMPQLIRRCVEYASPRVPGLRLTATTNGSALAGPVADFVAAHDFNLLVSLDGPPEVHDRERVSFGGGGSFHRLWANLNRLRERHPEYYQRSVHFQSTVADPADYERIVGFFLSHPNLFGAGKVQIVPASDESMEARPSSSATAGLFARYEKKLLCNAIGDDAESKLLQALLERPFVVLHKRRISLNGEAECGHTGQPCFPGYGRIFVSSDGGFHICEKVDRRLACGCLGRGIHGDEVMAQYEYYFQMRRDHCCRCWAAGICGLCYVHFLPRGGERSASAHRRRCAAAIEYHRQVLARYCAILEENPQAFDHIDSIATSGSPVPDWERLIGVGGGEP